MPFPFCFGVQKQCHSVCHRMKDTLSWRVPDFPRKVNSYATLILTQRYFGPGPDTCACRLKLFFGDCISAKLTLEGHSGYTTRTVLGVKDPDDNKLLTMATDLREFARDDIIDFPNFMTRDWMSERLDDVMVDNVLTIVVSVWTWTLTTDPGPLFRLPERFDTKWDFFLDHSKDLNGNGNLFLKTGSLTMAVSKELLVKRSTKLACLIEPLRNNEVLKISGINEWQLKQLVLYIYSWKVPQLTMHRAQLLLTVAERFCLVELGCRCFDFLCSSLDPDNVLDVMVNAHHARHEYVVKACAQFVLRSETRHDQIRNMGRFVRAHPRLMGKIMREKARQKFAGRVTIKRPE